MKRYLVESNHTDKDGAMHYSKPENFDTLNHATEAAMEIVFGFSEGLIPFGPIAEYHVYITDMVEKKRIAHYSKLYTCKKGG